MRSLAADARAQPSLIRQRRPFGSGEGEMAYWRQALQSLFGACGALTIGACGSKLSGGNEAPCVESLLRPAASVNRGESLVAWWGWGQDSRERSSFTARPVPLFWNDRRKHGVGRGVRNDDACTRLVLLVRGSAGTPVNHSHRGKKGGLFE
jgi:hypothetical protein